MNYFISDTHFGHVNVLKFDKRPFKNIDEMNSTIINNWNNKVNDDDHIWILGDFCYRSANPPEYYLSQLRGHKHLLIGNHDKTVLNSKSAISMFDSIQKLQHIKDGKHNIILCHFPLAEWDGMYRGSYHIYGHIHNKHDAVYRFMSMSGKALNAGCMINNYTPVTFDELIVNNQIHSK